MVGIDLTPISRCTSVKYTLIWSILGCTPRRGALRDTQRNGRWGRCWVLDYKAIPGRSFCMVQTPFFRQRLSEIHKETSSCNLRPVRKYLLYSLLSSFFRQRHNHDSSFLRFFQRCPPKRFPNCFISLHFSPPKSHAPQRYSEIYILAWTQLPHFESHVT